MPTMKMNLKQLALARDWIKNCQSQEGFDARSDGTSETNFAGQVTPQIREAINRYNLH
jgi:hypothetical protein